ncbi:MAG: hypothetical protein Q4B33_05465 [Fusobacterium sp.]|nr:hypothetical protein [Fusobacterium sp.]
MSEKKQNYKGSIDLAITTLLDLSGITDEDERKITREGIREQIDGEIKNELYPKLLEMDLPDIRKEWEEEEKLKTAEENKKHIKTLVMETIFIGFLLGLFVNQVTEIISNSKGVPNINLHMTYMWTIGLGISIFLSIVFLWFKTVKKIKKKEK